MQTPPRFSIHGHAGPCRVNDGREKQEKTRSSPAIKVIIAMSKGGLGTNDVALFLLSGGR